MSTDNRTVTEVGIDHNVLIQVEDGFNKTKTGVAFKELLDSKDVTVGVTLGSILTVHDVLLKILNNCLHILSHYEKGDPVVDQDVVKTHNLIDDVVASVFEASNDMKNDVMKDHVDEYFLSNRFGNDMLFIIDAVDIVVDAIFAFEITGDNVGREIIDIKAKRIAVKLVADNIRMFVKHMKDGSTYESKYDDLIWKLS